MVTHSRNAGFVGILALAFLISAVGSWDLARGDDPAPAYRVFVPAVAHTRELSPEERRELLAQLAGDFRSTTYRAVYDLPLGPSHMLTLTILRRGDAQSFQVESAGSQFEIPFGRSIDDGPLHTDCAGDDSQVYCWRGLRSRALELGGEDSFPWNPGIETYFNASENIVEWLDEREVLPGPELPARTIFGEDARCFSLYEDVAEAHVCIGTESKRVLEFADIGGAVLRLRELSTMVEASDFEPPVPLSDPRAHLLKMDPTTGETKWEQPRAMGTTSTPVVMDGEIFVQGSHSCGQAYSPGRFVILSAETGSPVAGGEIGDGCPAPMTTDPRDGSPLLSAAARGQIYGIENETTPAGSTFSLSARVSLSGEPRWRVNFGPAEFFANPVPAGDFVLLTFGRLNFGPGKPTGNPVPITYTVAYDSSTGEEMWRLESSEFIGPLAADESQAYSLILQNLAAYDLATGTVNWTRTVSPGLYSLAAGAGVVVLGGSQGIGQGTIVALDASTGADLWTQPTSGHPAFAIDANSLYAAVTGAYIPELGR